MAKQGELDPLISADGQVTPTRWWMCFVLSAIAFEQGWIWNTWGPISPAVQDLLGWSDDTFALLANWGPICYFIAVAPTSWLLDVRGLRLVCLIGAFLCFAGAVARCFTIHGDAALALAHIGQALNGLTGPVAMAAAPVLSATWFPVKERTTATAIMSMANNLGVAASFVVGPWLVPKGKDDDTASHNILVYMWISAGMATAIFLMTLAYFPNKPPSAPTVSAGSSRVDFIAGFKALMVMPRFWVIALAYGIMTGVNSGWSSYLAPNLENFLDEDTAEDTSGWLGFYSTLAGCGGSLVLGRFADLLGGRMKAMIITLNVLATAAFLWFTLICNNVAPSNTAYLYVSTIIGGLFISATTPVYYELAVESVYPIAEGITTGLVTTANNVGCLIFLLLPYMSKSLGSSWANWCMTAACAFSSAIMIFFREEYRRMTVDKDDTRPHAYGTLQ